MGITDPAMQLKELEELEKQRAQVKALYRVEL